MSVIRVNKTSNYTVLSNYHFKERGMSLKAKGLLSLMLSLPDDWNYSVSGLVRLSKDGKDSVMSALAELEAFGYLTRNKLTNSKGQFSGVEYNIFEQPQLENPIADKQNAEKENADKRNAEEPPQLNTNKLNTNSIKNTNELNPKGKSYLELEEFEDILKDIVNVDLRNLYIDYIEMRRITNAPMTKRAFKMLVQRCERLSNFNIRVQKLLLETAIINNWKNVYPPRESELARLNDDIRDTMRSMFGLEE